MASEVISDVMTNAPKDLTKLEYDVLLRLADSANADRRIVWTPDHYLAEQIGVDTGEITVAIQALHERAILRHVPAEELPLMLRDNPYVRRITTADFWL